MNTRNSTTALSIKCYICDTVKEMIKDKKKVLYRHEKRQSRRLRPYI